jgi:hypothetical protein
MSNFTEQYLQFFRGRPDLFEESCKGQLEKVINDSEYFVFGCLEFKQFFNDNDVESKNARLFQKIKHHYSMAPNLSLYFQFDNRIDAIDYIYIHKFHESYQQEISLESFLEFELSDELRKYFLFNANLWDRFDNGKR